MRTTLMVSLLAVSLGFTATCLMVIRLSVKQEIRKGLDSDLSHSLSTFRGIASQRNQMLAREAALLADLPSLKALMSTQDVHTIEDGAGEFYTTSGADFFALASTSGQLYSHVNRGKGLDDGQVTEGVRACMTAQEGECLTPFGSSVYELSIQPIYFGPATNESRLGYVIVGYAIDHAVARQISDVAEAEVAFLVDGNVSVSTLGARRLGDLMRQSKGLESRSEAAQSIVLGGEAYTAVKAALPAGGNRGVELIVFKSYDRASMYLRQVNRWILTLGICALILGLLLAAYISRTITLPLEVLVAGARALGQGDFSYRLSASGAFEVRELGLAFDRMRKELQRTQQELIEADRLATIGRMASSVSHDLRHHLSTIYANAEFMSLDRIGKQERVELMAEVQEGVQGMTDLIESLLLFSQTGQVLHLQDESMAMLVKRTVHSVRQHPECREVEIVVGELADVEANVDGAKLGRALYNLLLNACQAAGGCGGLGDGLDPSVSVLLTEERGEIRIAIADNGGGISESIRDTLFQPFVSAGKVNGTGLGLTVAQHIAQEHGGEVRLETTQAGNTVFSLVLSRRALEVLGRGRGGSVRRSIGTGWAAGRAAEEIPGQEKP